MADFVSDPLMKSIHNAGRRLRSALTTSGVEYSLHDGRGRRKYLVAAERAAFVLAADIVGGEVATFCMVLALSGARLSEVLALTPAQLDELAGTINFETLKRRKRGVIRAVPMPTILFDQLDRVHGFREAQRDPLRAGARLWDWSRTTGWRKVRRVMRTANNPLHLSNARAVRHAFGAQAALSQIPLTQIKKWMGHAKLETTEIYTSLTGDQERQLARLTWSGIELMQNQSNSDTQHNAKALKS